MNTIFEDKERPRLRKNIMIMVESGTSLKELARPNGHDNKTIFTSEGIILQAKKMIREGKDE